MCNNYVSKKLLKKATHPVNIINVYSDNILADFYHKTTPENGFYNDLEFFKNNLAKKENIVELASGTGRILKPLIDDGFNVMGVESEIEMIEILPMKYRKYIINSNILDFQKVESLYEQAECFIIPATSISLFSIKEIERLFLFLSQLKKSFKVYFDVIDMTDFLINTPKKEMNIHGTFYYLNFQYENFIIYNIYHKDTNTLGYSKKYAHSKKSLKTVLNKFGFDYKFLNSQKNYYMVRADYNV